MTDQHEVTESGQNVPPFVAPEDAVPVYLERIDADQNMRRFYTLSLQPGLFGDVGLVRNWGRIGTSGQSRTEWYQNEATASAALIGVSVRKRRKGYAEH